MGDQKNLLLAILASLVVLLGFQLLFPAKEVPKTESTQEINDSIAPAPEIIALLVKYSKRFNSFQNRRHEVLPGITGLAQIKGRNQISWEEKFIYDVQYIDEHNFLLDIKILFKTMTLVLFFKGTSPKGQDIMSEFMGSKENENN